MLHADWLNFVVVTTILQGSLAAIWGKESWFDLAIKLVLSGMALWGLFLLLLHYLGEGLV